MNEIKLLVVVPTPPVDILVPSGTMLQVIVAGAPFPGRGPEAVESHGSGLFVLIMNAWDGVANTAQKSTSNNTYAESGRMINSCNCCPPDVRSSKPNHIL